MRLFGRELSLTAQSMLLVQKSGAQSESTHAGEEQTRSIVNVLMTPPVAASVKGSSSKTYLKVLLIGGTAFLFAYAGYKLWRGLGHTKIDSTAEQKKTRGTDETHSTEPLAGNSSGNDMEVDPNQGFSLHPMKDETGALAPLEVDPNQSSSLHPGTDKNVVCDSEEVGGSIEAESVTVESYNTKVILRDDTQVIENRSKPLTGEERENDKDSIDDEADFKDDGRRTNSRWHYGRTGSTDSVNSDVGELRFDPDFSVPPGVMWSELCEDAVPNTEYIPQGNRRVVSSTSVGESCQDPELHLQQHSSINLSRIPTIVVSPPLSEVMEVNDDIDLMASISYVHRTDEFELKEDPLFSVPAGVNWADICPEVSNSDVRALYNDNTSSLSTLASTSDESFPLQPDPSFSIPTGALWADVCEQAEIQGGAEGLSASDSGDTPWCEDDGAGDGFKELPFVQSEDDAAFTNGNAETESDDQSGTDTISSESTFCSAVEEVELQRDPLFSVPSGVMWADICNDPNQTVNDTSNDRTDDTDVATFPSVNDFTDSSVTNGNVSTAVTSSSGELSDDGSKQAADDGVLEGTGFADSGNCNSNNSNGSAYDSGDACLKPEQKDTTDASLSQNIELKLDTVDNDASTADSHVDTDDTVSDSIDVNSPGDDKSHHNNDDNGDGDDDDDDDDDDDTDRKNNDHECNDDGFHDDDVNDDSLIINDDKCHDDYDYPGNHEDNGEDHDDYVDDGEDRDDDGENYDDSHVEHDADGSGQAVADSGFASADEILAWNRWYIQGQDTAHCGIGAQVTDEIKEDHINPRGNFGQNVSNQVGGIRAVFIFQLPSLVVANYGKGTVLDAASSKHFLIDALATGYASISGADYDDPITAAPAAHDDDDDDDDDGDDDGDDDDGDDTEDHEVYDNGYRNYDGKLGYMTIACTANALTSGADDDGPDATMSAEPAGDGYVVKYHNDVDIVNNVYGNLGNASQRKEGIHRPFITLPSDASEVDHTADIKTRDDYFAFSVKNTGNQSSSVKLLDIFHFRFRVNCMYILGRHSVKFNMLIRYNYVHFTTFNIDKNVVIVVMSEAAPIYMFEVSIKVFCNFFRVYFLEFLPTTTTPKTNFHFQHLSLKDSRLYWIMAEQSVFNKYP